MPTSGFVVLFATKALACNISGNSLMDNRGADVFDLNLINSCTFFKFANAFLLASWYTFGKHGIKIVTFAFRSIMLRIIATPEESKYAMENV